MTSIKRIVLVTPVWNDSERLAAFGMQLAEALSVTGMSIRWIIADDGSDASERVRYAEVLRRFQAIYPDVELMHFSPRSRKGGAVYQAWDQCPEADYYGFVDADGAVSAEAMLGLLKRLVDEVETCGIVGVRATEGPLKTHRQLLRALSFNVFRFLVRAIVGLRSTDTQCGAKAITAQAYREVADRLYERGFVFDVELLLALKVRGLAVEEMALTWKEMPGSRVNVWRDSRQMLAGLVRIRRRLKTGIYTALTQR